MTTNASWLEHIEQSLQLYASVAFFSMYSLLLHLCTLASKVA